MDWVRQLLDDVQATGKMLSKGSADWEQMYVLKDSREDLQKMLEIMEAAFDKEGNEKDHSGESTEMAGVKYSRALGGKLANNGIERDMPDAERAEVLRNMEIQTVPLAKLSSEAQTLVERLKKGGMGRKEIFNAINALPEGE